MASRFAICLLGTAAVIGSACAGSPAAPSVLDGIWGGDHVTMSIAGATHVELDCAHGDIPAPLAIDDQRQFNTTGTFVREHGGPIRDGEVPDTHPARYSGSVTGDRMQLTIRLTDTNETIGTFSLTRGAQGRVVKCL